MQCTCHARNIPERRAADLRAIVLSYGERMCSVTYNCIFCIFVGAADNWWLVAFEPFVINHKFQRNRIAQYFREAFKNLIHRVAFN